MYLPISVAGAQTLPESGTSWIILGEVPATAIDLQPGLTGQHYQETSNATATLLQEQAKRFIPVIRTSLTIPTPGHSTSFRMVLEVLQQLAIQSGRTLPLTASGATIRRWFVPAERLAVLTRSRSKVALSGAQSTRRSSRSCPMDQSSYFGIRQKWCLRRSVCSTQPIFSDRPKTPQSQTDPSSLLSASTDHVITTQTAAQCVFTIFIPFTKSNRVWVSSYVAVA